jgi:hypothetical protein
MTPEVESGMERIVKRNMLKYQVAQTMFCPYCHACLDTERAVSVDVMRSDKLIASKIACAECWDRGKERLNAMLQANGYTIDVTDGRELFKRGAR